MGQKDSIHLKDSLQAAAPPQKKKSHARKSYCFNFQAEIMGKCAHTQTATMTKKKTKHKFNNFLPHLSSLFQRD